jgi:hypothetical protein
MLSKDEKFYFCLMKMLTQLFKLASLACLFFVANSCNDELNLVEPTTEPTPIVYGFLSLNDTTTYIRVERSFISIKSSAVELAKVADSLTYPANVEVYLVRASNNERYPLQKVDGNAEGLVRDAGVFASKPNYLYKIKTSTLLLKSNELWRVEVQRKGEAKPIATSKTNVIGTYDIITSLGLNVITSFSVSFETRTDVAITKESDRSAKYYNVKVIFNYDETISGVTTRKRVDWQMLTNEKRVGATDPTYDQQNFSKSGNDFFQFLGNNIPATAGAARLFKDIEIEITAGGQEVVDFLSVGIANLGITGSQTIPTYSNVFDKNGITALGIFGSRNKFSKKGFFLNDGSLENLKTGTYTKQLNFR